MKNEHSLQDEMEDLTQDFASCYTAVERETRQETMYRKQRNMGEFSDKFCPRENRI
jgi:hypothetical protein